MGIEVGRGDCVDGKGEWQRQRAGKRRRCVATTVEGGEAKPS